jgi:hypothetical protein
MCSVSVAAVRQYRPPRARLVVHPRCAVVILAATLSSVARGQAAPPSPQSLENITSCSVDGSDVFIGTGKGADSRRYKYAWDPSIDALCNAKGFAIASPAKATGSVTTQAPISGATAANPATPPAATLSNPSTPDALGFPPGATKLEPTQLTQLVSGRVAKILTGPQVGARVQYDTNGVVYYNGAGANFSGRWRVDGSSLCYEWNRNQAPTGCIEVRMVGERIYYRRMSGEILQMEISK